MGVLLLAPAYGGPATMGRSNYRRQKNFLTTGVTTICRPLWQDKDFYTFVVKRASRCARICSRKRLRKQTSRRYEGPLASNMYVSSHIIADDLAFRSGKRDIWDKMCTVGARHWKLKHYIYLQIRTLENT